MFIIIPRPTLIPEESQRENSFDKWSAIYLTRLQDNIMSISNHIDMKSLVLFVVLVFVGFGKSDALISCVCSDCEDGTCPGEICYSKVTAGREPGTNPVYTQRCYFEAQAHLCNTSTSYHTVLCCESELCNADLHPVLYSGDSSTSSADYLSSTEELYSSTDSEDGGYSHSEPTAIVATTASPPPPPPPSVAGTCYVSDSSRGTEIRLCNLRNYCFSTLRRQRDGTVVFKRGCSNACEEESRNRKIKRCCTSSLCNTLIQDPLEENGSGTTITPLIQEMTTHPSSTSPSRTMPPPSSSRPSPPPPPPTNTSTPSTYQPPILNPNPPTPTSPPPTTPPTGMELTCYCDTCGEATICRTYGSCATLWAYRIPEPGSIPDPNPQSRLTITNFCISNVVSCQGELFMNPGEVLNCCNTSYCNNHQDPTTAPPREPTEPTTAAIVVETTGSEDDIPTSRTTPTLPSASQRNLDFYFIVGIGIFIVAGVILVAVAIVVICYCCITRQRSSSRVKAKRAASLPCPSTIVTTAGGITAAVANMELAVGAKLSFPSPNIYAKQRESVSVSTEGNSSNSGTGSSAPVPEGIPRTAYSSTSV